MPPDQRVWFHDREHRPPVNQPGKRYQCDPERIIGTARFDAALLVKRQLLAQKRFSAARCDRDRRPSDINRRASDSNRTVVLHTVDDDARFRMVKDATTTGRRRPARTRGEFSFDQNICGSQRAAGAPGYSITACRSSTRPADLISRNAPFQSHHTAKRKLGRRRRACIRGADMSHQRQMEWHRSDRRRNGVAINV